MIPYVWSPKQRDLVETLASGREREVVVSGPVQSGKSVSAWFGFFGFASMWAGHDFIVASRSQRQLTGSVLKYAREFSDSYGLGWRKTEDCYVMENFEGDGLNRFFPLIGADVSSEAKARSFTVAGAGIDEATLVPFDFTRSVSDRCSVPNALLMLVTNPSGPKHPIKADRIDKGVCHYPFEMSDNPNVTDQYLESLARSYKGPMYERMVQGKWVQSEGVIYPFWEAGNPPGGFVRYVLGVDWAHKSVTHAVLVGYLSDGTAWVVGEWRHNGVTHGVMEAMDQARAIRDRLCSGIKPSLIVCDPSAPQMKQALSRAFGQKVYNAQNDVIKGIQYVRQSLEERSLMIGHACPELKTEMFNYVWDEKMSLIGEHKPVKQDDHGCDALRYAVYTAAFARKRDGRRPKTLRL